jgi:hypothetical protein
MKANELSQLYCEEILAISNKILQMGPDPIPRYLVLRELNQIGVSDSELQGAKRALFNARWVQELHETQWADGTWGRFHTQDTKAKQAIPTTEIGIDLALAYGLNKHDALLAKTVTFIEDHIAGKESWRDRAEKHDDPNLWQVLTPFISAANLALIDDDHEMLGYFVNSWVEIVMAAFQSGTYDRQAEIDMFNEGLKLHTKNPPAFHNKYPLILLSSKISRLDPQLEGRILDHILSRPDGVYYLYDGLLSQMPAVSERKFYYWLATQLILSRFPGWFHFIEPYLIEMLSQHSKDGLWSFSERVPRRPYSPLPLSESWYRKANKCIDCSVLILKLLSHYCQGARDKDESSNLPSSYGELRMN